MWQPAEKCTPGLACFDRLRRAMATQLSTRYGEPADAATGSKGHVGIDSRIVDKIYRFTMTDASRASSVKSVDKICKH